MTKNRKIKWGILGPGVIAQQFAHDFPFTKYAELHAVASTDEERAKSFAKQFNIPQVHIGYENLVSDPNLDAIYIATPHVFHFEHSLLALKAGKAVLCEKPLNESLEKTEKLIQQAKKLNTYLAEGMWTYFLPAIQQAQQWVKNGEIGEILHIKSDFGFGFPYNPENRKFDPSLGGGAVLDMGIYNIAISWLFMQKTPTNVTSFSHMAPTGVDDDVTMLFEFEKALACLHTSFRAKLHNQTQIIGRNGYILIPDFWKANECLLFQNNELKEHYKDGRKGNGFNFEIDAVSQDILNGKVESPKVPHKTSLEFMKQMKLVMDEFNV